MPRKTAKIASSPPAPTNQSPLRLEWRSPEELAENPRNWRTHSAEQMAALGEITKKVGWAGACLFNEATGRLVDGHARRALAASQGCQLIPVLVGSWSEDQERLILASLDPLAAMAGSNQALLQDLLRGVAIETTALADQLNGLVAQLPDAETEAPPADAKKTGRVPEKFGVLIQCQDEAEQSSLLDRFLAEGLTCRALIS